MLVDQNHQNLLRKLLYQSSHRGCKETDILLGKYANAKLSKFKYEQLLDYQHLLNQTDADIISWTMFSTPHPDDINHHLITDIINFIADKSYFDTK